MTVDVPDVTDAGTVTTSAAGLVTVAFGKTFVVVPSLGTALQNAATGDFEVIQNITSTGFDYGVKTAGGSFAVRTSSYLAAGY